MATKKNAAPAEAEAGADTTLVSGDDQVSQDASPGPSPKEAEVLPSSAPVAPDKPAKTDSPAPVTPAAIVDPPPHAPPAPSVQLYRVWSHGTLQRDGKVYQPGETLTLPTAEAEKIPCLEPA